MWTMLVDLVRATIFAGAHVAGGSLGAGVVLVSAAVRLALLPLSLRAAREARVQREKLEALRPQLEQLKRRYASDQRRLLEETMALQRANGVRLVGPATFAAMAIQLPLLGGLFAAVRSGLGARVRFLWIADLSRVDMILLLAASALSGVTASVAPAAGTPASTRTMIAVAVGGTLLFLWSASSAVALSVGAGSVVSVLQNWILRREQRPSLASSAR
jgi:YidC/Oxa1 family membrane protein insertase